MMVIGSLRWPISFSPQTKSGFPPNACWLFLWSMAAMKICIQHSGTRKFLRGIDTWVDGSAGARHFVNSMDAFRHCVDHGLAAVNIIVDYGTTRAPLIIPVDPDSQRTAPLAPASHR